MIRAVVFLSTIAVLVISTHADWITDVGLKFYTPNYGRPYAFGQNL